MFNQFKKTESKDIPTKKITIPSAYLRPEYGIKQPFQSPVQPSPLSQEEIGVFTMDMNEAIEDEPSDDSAPGSPIKAFKQAETESERAFNQSLKYRTDLPSFLSECVNELKNPKPKKS